MKELNWRTWLPTLVAIATFIVLGLTYFSPVLEGKQLVQGDKLNWMGMAQEIKEHREAFDEEPLWTGSMFSGMPAYQITTLYPSNLMLKVDTVLHLGLPRPVSFLFMYLLGMFMLLRVLKIDPWLSLIGAIAFAFSSYFFIILEAGHNSKANAISYMAPTFAGLYLLFRGKNMLWGAVVFAFFLALEIAMNHVQITYYLGFVMLFFSLAEALRLIRERRVPDLMKRASVGLAAVSLALATNAGMLWSTFDYAKYTTRGPSELTISADGSDAGRNQTDGLDRDYVTDWSEGIDESLTLLVPNAMGGATGYVGSEAPALRKADPRFRQNLAQMNSYWGEQRFVSGPVYLGAIIVLLLFLQIGLMERKEMFWTLASIPVVILLTQFTEPVLAGMLVIAYILAGLFLTTNTLRYALFSGLFLTLLLSWGKNLMPLTDFFLDHFPAYNKFRAVTIILVIVELVAPILGILYLDRIIREGKWDKERTRRFLIPAGVLIAVLLLLMASPEGATGLLSENERASFNQQIDDSPGSEAQIVAFVQALKDMRASMFKADAMRSLLFVLAGAVLIFLFGKGKLSKVPLIAGLGLLILIDLWSVDKRYVNNEKQRGQYVRWEDETEAMFPYQPQPADLNILSDERNDAVMADAEATFTRMHDDLGSTGSQGRKLDQKLEFVSQFAALRRNTHFRVFSLNNPFNDARTSYFHKSLGGYHGAKLERYQELIEFHLTPELSSIGALLQGGTDMQTMNDRLASKPVLNMLNTRYLIVDPQRAPLRNVNALGNAWFVDQVQWAKNADEEILALGKVDPARTALIDERYRAQLGTLPTGSDPSAMIQLETYRANYLKYRSRSSTAGVVVFSEIWYGPDWQAFIDGRPSAHVRADYTLRAMLVPEGEHEIEFKLISRSYNASSMIALASSGALLLLLLGMVFTLWRARPSEE